MCVSRVAAVLAAGIEEIVAKEAQISLSRRMKGRAATAAAEQWTTKRGHLA
jgi:hypothetical protein